MSVSLGELMLAIENLRVDSLRELARYCSDRADAKELRGTMLDVVREQRHHNPVTSQEPSPRMVVASGVSTGGTMPIESWRPPHARAMDALMDEDDRQWRAQRRKELEGGGGGG
jgi:hypothetical protein